MSALLKDTQDKLAAKQQELHAVFDKAGAEVDFSKPDVLSLVGAKTSAEVVEKVRAMNAELEELGRTRDEMAEMDSIRAGNEKRRSAPVNVLPFPGSDERAEGEGRKVRKSLGRAIVESKAWQNFAKFQQPSQSIEEGVEFKTAFSTGAGWAPESLRIPGLVIDKATRPIQVLDLIPTAPTTQAAVVYMEETTFTNNAAERAENAVYAENAFALTQRSETVVTIGASVPVTDEQLQDVPQAEAYLNQRLGFSVRQRADSQILNGDGNAPNMTGILNKANIQTQAKGSDAAQDAFYKAMVNIRVTGRAVPNAHIINPTDWQDIRLQRTSEGMYIWGSPAEAGPERMWGLQVVQADSLAAGTGIVGDFANFCQLYERAGIEVAVGFTGSDFTYGRKTVRAGMRVAFVIYRAAAFSTVTGI